MNENDKIIKFLERNYYQLLSNKRYWCSYENEDDWVWVHLTKEFSNRTSCRFNINFGSLTDSTPNLIINLYTVVDLEWVQVFWGNIETLENLKFILKCIGIPYKDEETN